MTTGTKVVSSNLVHGTVYSIQHYVIKFVSDLRQFCGFINEGETTRGERESGRTGFWAKRPGFLLTIFQLYRGGQFY
jgi:hypothetical protein